MNSVNNLRSIVSSCETLITEALERPEGGMVSATLPGAWANTLLVIYGDNDGFCPAQAERSDWTMRTGGENRGRSLWDLA